ncbi:GNAT family N-acetyltransferase [Thermodesulfobacteriota bacterium]
MEPDSTSDAKSKRPPIRIRAMEIDDLPKVFHLGERLFQAETVPNMYRTWDEFEVVALYNGDSEFCLVAEMDDRVVGFALGTTITKSHSAWKYGHLVWLGMEPSLQRQGIAEKLFHRFKDLMLKANVRMLLVDTPAENLPALHFFRKHGFGNPQQHIYLTMNLASQLSLFKRRLNGEQQERQGRKTDG